MRILILCTGNSCRSQMAEGLLKSLDKGLKVYSAGTNPTNNVHPMAIEVMKEIGVDISQNKPKNVDQFLTKKFEYVITVCGGAKESCPIFDGKVNHHLHIGFEDPADAKGTLNEVKMEFVKIRNEILVEFFSFWKSI